MAKKPTGKASRAAIYCRKSSDDKGGKDASMSVRAQETDCRAIIEREGWTLAGMYVDDGISGRTYPSGEKWDAQANGDTLTVDYIAKQPKKRRPGLGNMLNDIMKGKIDIVVVRDMPRLARPVFQSTFSSFIPTFFQSHNVSVYSKADGLVDFSDFGRMLSFFLADALLDRELKTRAKHSAEAVQQEKAKGRYMGGCAPFGFAYNKNKKLIQDKKTAGYVVDLFRETLKGVGIGIQIKRMNQLGVKTPRGNAIQEKIGRLFLKNPLYCGKIRYNGRLIDCIDVVEPIIDTNTYYKMQKIFKSRAGIKSNRAKSTGGLASGISSCGLCGYSMILRKTPQGNHSYRCIMNKSGTCTCALNQGNLDEYLSHFIALKDILAHEDSLERMKEKERLPELIEQETSLNDQITELTDKMKARKIDIGKFIDIMDEMKDELAQVQQRIVELQNIPDVSNKKQLKTVFKPKNEMTLNEKRNAVRVVFKHITVCPDRVVFDLHSGETFTIKRVELGKNRRWLSPVLYSKEQTGEKGHVFISHGADAYIGKNALLKGKLIISNYNASKDDVAEASKMKKHIKKIEEKPLAKPRRHPGSSIS